MLKEMFSSEARANLGETLDEVYDKKMPVIIKKKVAGGSKDFIFISKEVFNDFLNDIDFSINVFNEDDGSITLELEELELISNGDTLETATEELVDDLIIYMGEYIENIQLYSITPNRKEHLKYIIKATIYEDKDSLIDSFKYIYQN